MVWRGAADLERPAPQILCCMQQVTQQVHSKVRHRAPCGLSLQKDQHPEAHRWVAGSVALTDNIAEAAARCGFC